MFSSLSPPRTQSLPQTFNSFRKRNEIAGDPRESKSWRLLRRARQLEFKMKQISVEKIARRCSFSSKFPFLSRFFERKKKKKNKIEFVSFRETTELRKSCNFDNLRKTTRRPIGYFANSSRKNYEAKWKLSICERATFTAVDLFNKKRKRKWHARSETK